MRNNRYLDNLFSLWCIFIILMPFFIYSPIVLAEDSEANISEGLETTTDSEYSWYAIMKIDGVKKKLYTKGDIFYSTRDINKCFRIQDIKKEFLILIDVNSKDIIIVKVGERIPLEGAEIIFEKTVERDSIKLEH